MLTMFLSHRAEGREGARKFREDARGENIISHFRPARGMGSNQFSREGTITITREEGIKKEPTLNVPEAKMKSRFRKEKKKKKNRKTEKGHKQGHRSFAFFDAFSTPRPPPLTHFPESNQSSNHAGRPATAPSHPTPIPKAEKKKKKKTTQRLDSRHPTLTKVPQNRHKHADGDCSPSHQDIKVPCRPPLNVLYRTPRQSKRVRRREQSSFRPCPPSFNPSAPIHLRIERRKNDSTNL